MEKLRLSDGEVIRSLTPAPHTHPKQKPHDALRGSESLQVQTLAPQLITTVGHCTDILTSLGLGFHITSSGSHSPFQVVVKVR